MSYKFKRDCRSFPDIFSCDTMTAESYKDCKDCKFYDKISKKILIIKLGAMGDVIRTTPLILLIKKKYSGAHITWLVNENSKELAKADRVLVYNLDNILRLQNESFDIVFSLEIDAPGSAIANLIKAKKKYGFYLDKDGHPNCFNKNSKFYLERVFSNFVNKNNNKTYQEMMAEIMELYYEKNEPVLDLDEKYGKEFINKLQDKLIGIHMGSAPRWPSKIWSKDKLVEFIRKIYSETNYKVLLFAGPNEIKKQKEILDELSDLEIYYNDPNNSIKEFISLVNVCHVMIVNDSLALHVSIALKKKTIALFFCTPDWEIEDYGYVKKIVSPLLKKHFFTDEYLEELVNSISMEQVFEALNSFN